MDAVVDTNVLHSFVLQPRRRTGAANLRATPLDDHIEAGRLRLALDLTRGLLTEWEQTCGAETVGVFIAKWEASGGIVLVQQLGRLPPKAIVRLKRLGFRGTVDKLVLRIALAISGRTVVSRDSDFWDPARPQLVGRADACVTRFCREELGVTIVLLPGLLHQLRQR
jgi:hypothetical protein